MRFLSIFSLLFITAAQAQRPAAVSKESPLHLCHEALSKLRSVSYTYYRHANYPSENYSQQFSGFTFFDLSVPSNLINASYYFENEDYIAVYNGVEAFHCDKTTGTMHLLQKPDTADIESESFLPSSILSLRNALPRIMADDGILKTFSDTLIGSDTCYKIRLALKQQMISAIGMPWPVAKRDTIFYSIITSKETGLPLQVIQGNNENSDLFITRFVKIRTNIPLSDPALFYYSSYRDKFKQEQKITTPLIAAGATAPPFALPSFYSKKIVELNAVSSAYTLLVFWVKNCGYSQSVVAPLNSLAGEIPGKQLSIVMVNSYDNEEAIQNFINLTHPAGMDILMNGDAVRKQYGVYGFPSVVLCDKNKKVLYAGNFDREKINALISR